MQDTFVFGGACQVETHTRVFTLPLQEAEGLVLINIDDGTVTHSGDGDLAVPSIPLLAARAFIQR